MRTGIKHIKYQAAVVNLHFESTSEFETLFKSHTLKVTNAIVQGIEEAMQDKKKTAQLFELTFSDADMVYEITLPSSQWPQALQSCLDHYHELQMADEQIDTWKLLEAAKVW